MVYTGSGFVVADPDHFNVDLDPDSSKLSWSLLTYLMRHAVLNFSFALMAEWVS